MEDKEILAELKISYEYLQDIIDNADNTQLKSIVELEEAQNILAKKYEEIYRKIKNENDISLFYEENLLIGNCIYYDFITDDDKTALTYQDTDGKTKWWEDIMFLEKF